jgi:AraC-like DNA-binding protein
MIYRSDIAIDPFSDLLRLASVQTLISGEFFASGAWAMQFPKPEGLKFFAILKGHCWLQLAEREPIRIDEGDVVLMHWTDTYRIASDLDAPLVDISSIIQQYETSKSAILGDGSEFHQMGGHVSLDPERGTPIAELLPPLLHIRANSPQAPVLKWLLDQLVRERSGQHLGSALLTNQLAQMLFVHMLRIYLESEDRCSCTSWLSALTDRRLLPAIKQMHAAPQRAWRLSELARATAMSRTGFAVHFKQVTGITPLTYLTRWRMMLAQYALRHEDKSLSALVNELGYGSESAFSHAFKREVGVSPAHYRSRVRAVS